MDVIAFGYQRPIILCTIVTMDILVIVIKAYSLFALFVLQNLLLDTAHVQFLTSASEITILEV